MRFSPARRRYNRRVVWLSIRYAMLVIPTGGLRS